MILDTIFQHTRLMILDTLFQHTRLFHPTHFLSKPPYTFIFHLVLSYSPNGFSSFKILNLMNLNKQRILLLSSQLYQLRFARPVNLNFW